MQRQKIVYLKHLFAKTSNPPSLLKVQASCTTQDLGVAEVNMPQNEHSPRSQDHVTKVP